MTTKTKRAKAATKPYPNGRVCAICSVGDARDALVAIMDERIAGRAKLTLSDVRRYLFNQFGVDVSMSTVSYCATSHLNRRWVRQ